MSKEKNLIKLEKDIKSKMDLIKMGRLLPKDSGIGKIPLINLSISEISNKLNISKRRVDWCIKKYKLK